MSPWPTAGCMVCRRPAVPPSKAMRISPAHRHNSDSGPRAMRESLDGELSDVMLLPSEILRQVILARPLAPMQHMLTTDSGARKKLVPNSIDDECRDHGPWERAG